VKNLSTEQPLSSVKTAGFGAALIVAGPASRKPAAFIVGETL